MPASGADPVLPPGMRFVQRDWLSSNLFVFFDGEGADRMATVVDTGYHKHEAQTLALVAHLLAAEGLGMNRLTRIINTHLHSDHCGGKAALALASGARITVPQPQVDAVRRWDADRLTFRDFGQHCARFHAHEGLAPGQTLVMGGLRWQALAAPGHDPDSLILHCAEARLLISADALWENGFGILFPELAGESGYAEQGAVLELIAGLPVDLALPGHGRAFADVPQAIARARGRLQAFCADTQRNPRNSLKALIKFTLLARERLPLAQAVAEIAAVRVIGQAAAQLGAEPARAVDTAIRELVAQGQLALEPDGMLANAEPAL
jgi:glyoxylase-like metal-dependent hydrolase (beta-lactamase superfamily II)